jgi:SNF2 family DNA or RNA helicase
MGLGKTRQALAAAQQLDTDHILIVCPAGARRVWQQEIHRWVPVWDKRVVLVEPGTQVSQIQPKLSPSKPVILILSYDELSNLKSRIAFLLKLIRWDLLVLDEAHYLKNPSNRTQAIYGAPRGDKGLQAYADRVILLSGTPTPNHAGEMWQHYRTFWSQALSTNGPDGAARPLTQIEFEDRFTRYRDTVFGRQVTGSKNQGILREALAPVVLRRRKAEVLTELPPLQLQDIPLIYTPSAADAMTGTKDAVDRLSRAQSDDDVVRALQAIDTGTAALRQQLGLLKVAPTLLWVQERMASTRKLLIFAWHHTVIEDLRKGLVEFNPVVITGATSPKDRAEAIDQFQNHPNVRVFIGQVLAAGTAITLTAASEVAIVEPSWVPGENVQAISRAHRLGQHDSVLASFLYLPGTLDERIIKVFRRKAAEISELQGDHDASSSQPDLRHGNSGRAGAAHAVSKPRAAKSAAVVT